MKTGHILVVDDEPDIRNLLKEILEDEGHEVSVAENAAAAREARRARRPNLVLLDIWMPDVDGITLLKEWAAEGTLEAPVIMMSGHGTVETAVEATRLGAYDFIEKPLSHAKLLLTVRRALESATLEQENQGLRRFIVRPTEPIGRSTVIQELRTQALRIAQHETPVLITGESGVGKELFARFIHANSPRAEEPFEEIVLSGMNHGDLTVKLFGSEEGEHIFFGALERADGGSLFIKDVADMDLASQARLLGSLKNLSLIRAGGTESVSVNVRIIAATTCEPEQRIAKGSFREDLYYHLNVVPLKIPPLREHREDVPELLEYFATLYSDHESLPYRRFTVGAQNVLRNHEWPGNVRELHNLVQRLLILGTTEEIGAEDVEKTLGHMGRKELSGEFQEYDLPLRDAREQFEKAYLTHHLKLFDGNVSKVARHAGIERTHLYRKLRALGIDPKQLTGKK